MAKCLFPVIIPFLIMFLFGVGGGVKQKTMKGTYVTMDFTL